LSFYCLWSISRIRFIFLLILKSVFLIFVSFFFVMINQLNYLWVSFILNLWIIIIFSLISLSRFQRRPNSIIRNKFQSVCVLAQVLSHRKLDLFLAFSFSKILHPPLKLNSLVTCLLLELAILLSDIRDRSFRCITWVSWYWSWVCFWIALLIFVLSNHSALLFS
jgi:hypothetical protein